VIPATERRPAGAWLLGCVIAALTAACEPKADDLPEWSPADHNDNEKPVPAEVAETPPPPAGSPAMPPMLQEGGELGLAFVTWKQQCVRCHGPRGRGDGPESAMVHARDLAAASFQDGVSDEQIAATIRDGRGKMPAFGDELPANVIDGLVQLVRKMRAE
jgi:mono/diheme cytochrome c family protein